MNKNLETDIEQFGRFVEKVVRPIRVPMKRKKRMREELLCHMHEVLDEMENGHQLISQQDAVSQTIARMGEPTELTAELKSQETLYNRWYLYIEELRYDPAETVRVFLFKHACIGIALGVFTSILILALNFVKPNPLGVVGSIYVGFLTSFTHLLFAVPFLLLLDPITRSIYRLKGEPTRLRAICYLLASCFVLPTIAAAVNYRFPATLSFENMISGILMAPLFPLIILVASKPAAEEIIYHEKWANLEIES